MLRALTGELLCRNLDAALALVPPSMERSLEMNLARRANHLWSSEEDSELTGLMDDGQSAKAIAIKLKRTTLLIRRRAEILKASWRRKKTSTEKPALRKGPPKLSWTPEEDETLRALAQTQSAAAIADGLNRNNSL